MSELMQLMSGNHSQFDGKGILITGGTRSFGRAFIRTLLRSCEPARLVVFSRDEFKQYEMAQQLNGPNMRYFIGDVRDGSRLEMAMRGIDYVVHAAALKHVPIAEYNPFECISTNVFGAENVVRAALRTGVKKVIALSTDKAASPVNLYGASKVCSDKIFIAANNLAGADGPRFSVVRYGNVVGSRGSVVPYFRKLIAGGADHLPITDERATRFWITLDEGVTFVMSCFAMMCGGELFVPKIPSMRVVELAHTLAPHLPIKGVGLRPGEKIHELMITSDDARFTVDLGDRYAIAPHEHVFSKYLSEGEAVPETFSYASNTNPLWLDREGMMRLLGQVAAETASEWH